MRGPRDAWWFGLNTKLFGFHNYYCSPCPTDFLICSLQLLSQEFPFTDLWFPSHQGNKQTNKNQSCKTMQELNRMFYPYIVVMSRAELCLAQTGLEHFVFFLGKSNHNMQDTLVHMQNERFTPSKPRRLRFRVNKHLSWGKSTLSSYWYTQLAILEDTVNKLIAFCL